MHPDGCGKIIQVLDKKLHKQLFIRAGCIINKTFKTSLPPLVLHENLSDCMYPYPAHADGWTTHKKPVGMRHLSLLNIRNWSRVPSWSVLIAM